MWYNKIDGRKYVLSSEFYYRITKDIDLIQSVAGNEWWKQDGRDRDFSNYFGWQTGNLSVGNKLKHLCKFLKLIGGACDSASHDIIQDSLMGFFLKAGYDQDKIYDLDDMWDGETSHETKLEIILKRDLGKNVDACKDAIDILIGHNSYDNEVFGRVSSVELLDNDMFAKVVTELDNLIVQRPVDRLNEIRKKIAVRKIENWAEGKWYIKPKCPICFELLKRNSIIFNCGHAHCSPCAKKLNICSVCRGSISHQIKWKPL